MSLLDPAVVVPVGPGVETALDTLASVGRYCPKQHEVVIVDDCTRDGTYEAIVAARRPNWHVLRNPRSMGRFRLVHSLCLAYRFVLSATKCNLVLRLDQDALMIKSGVIEDAVSYLERNPRVGMFGVYSHDYDRLRSFECHEKQITRELMWPRRVVGLRPSWRSLLLLAERRGYRRGDNVFGGACFLTRDALTGMGNLGALDVPYRWNSRLMEDVYFSMATVAAGFDLGQFGAPEGPLCLEWEGLPYPASELVTSPYKVVHSVDKGKNTSRESNGGKTPREIFESLRSTVS
jgi:glycosyltransferase involved in cell wall biosynthesis